tara:strand:+ start:827 stop:1042 length:216 start_codon:yes stop_codon:yes gene_type:complete
MKPFYALYSITVILITKTKFEIMADEILKNWAIDLAKQIKGYSDILENNPDVNAQKYAREMLLNLSKKISK